MIRFLLKKNFFDCWDNILRVLVLNFFCMTIVAGFILFCRFAPDISLGAFLGITSCFVALLSLFFLGVNGNAVLWSDGNTSWFRGFSKAVKKCPWHFVLFTFAVLLSAFCFIVLIPFYLSANSYLSLISAILLIWLNIILLLGLQYFYPLAVLFTEDNPFITLKKSFALMFDNRAFTIALGLKTIFEFFISALTGFLLPGMTWMAVSHADAVKLLFIRHEYRKTHWTERRSDLNCYEMFKEENEKIGKRTIREMIFPWKNS